jgi:hypothetical protein
MGLGPPPFRTLLDMFLRAASMYVKGWCSGECMSTFLCSTWKIWDFKYKFQSAVDSILINSQWLPADFYSSVVEYCLPVNRLHLIQFWSGLWSTFRRPMIYWDSIHWPSIKWAVIVICCIFKYIPQPEYNHIREWWFYKNTECRYYCINAIVKILKKYRARGKIR